MKKNNRTKPDIKSLDKEIAILKFAKSVDKTDKQIKKIVKKDLITLGSIFGFAALYLVFIMSGMTIPAMIVACIAGGVGLVPLAKTIKKDLSNELIERQNRKIAMGSLKNSNSEDVCNKCKGKCDGNCLDNNNLKGVFKEVDLNFALSPKIDLDFNFDVDDALNFQQNYTEDFKRFLNDNDEDKIEDNEPKLKLIHTNLTMKETMEKLVNELEVYYNMYKIPPLTISNKEWDIIFEELYMSFCDKNKENLYSKNMSDYVKNVIINAIVEKPTSVGFNEFYNGLDIIFGIKIFGDIFSKREMVNIKKKILLKVKKSKVIDISHYERQNMKK